MKSKSFTELIVWQKAHKFVLDIYKITRNFPKEEIFGLTSQFRKAAVSVAANIAEGYKRKGMKDKIRFFNFSEGSLEECKYYIMLSVDLEYLTENHLSEQAEEIGKMIYGYRKGILKNREYEESGVRSQ